MTIYGWLMLIVSWSAITFLTAFAIRRTLRVPLPDLSAPLELEAEIEAEQDKRDAAS